jgi:hypothetical protein
MQCMHLLFYKRIRYHWMRFRTANLPCHIYCVTHHDRTILLLHLGMGQLRCCTTVVVLKTIKKPQQDWAAATIYGCVYLSINPQMIVHSTPFSNLVLVKSSILSQADEAMGDTYAAMGVGEWWYSDSEGVAYHSICGDYQMIKLRSQTIRRLSNPHLWCSNCKFPCISPRMQCNNNLLMSIISDVQSTYFFAGDVQSSLLCHG